MRKAASIALGASSGSMNRAAKNVLITRLKLMSPIPSVTGSISANTRFTAGSWRSITARMRPSRLRNHGTGVSTWMTVPARTPPA
jgi:hypothetical protein